jgi:threonine aldolase
MAGLLGKQSSIFVMSGTAANLLAASAYAALARGAGGAEVLLGDRAHAFLNSQGNLAKVTR